MRDRTQPVETKKKKKNRKTREAVNGTISHFLNVSTSRFGKLWGYIISTSSLLGSTKNSLRHMTSKPDWNNCVFIVGIWIHCLSQGRSETYTMLVCEMCALTLSKTQTPGLFRKDLSRSRKGRQWKRFPEEGLVKQANLKPLLLVHYPLFTKQQRATVEQDSLILDWR